MKARILLIWTLACKDWKLFLADRQGALLCFLVPILLASAFGTIFHRPAQSELPRLPVLLVVEDDSPFTGRVADALQANPHLVVERCTRASALARHAQNDNGVVLVLPAGFKRGFATDTETANRPEVEIHCQPGREYEGRWAEGVLTEVFLKQSAQEWLPPLAGASPLSLERPFAVRHQCLAGECSLAAHAYSLSFCGMTLQYLLFWGMDSGLLWLRERRRGLWRRVHVAPVSLSSLIAGKVLSTAVVALALIGVTFGFGAVVFGVRVNGSLLAFGGVALAAALLSATTGLLVASLGGTEGRARSLSILAILALSLLGGLWLPSFLMPTWVQRLALALPTTWASRGLNAVTWRGQGWTQVGPAILMVLAFALAFLLVALWRFSAQDHQRCCKGDCG